MRPRVPAEVPGFNTRLEALKDVRQVRVRVAAGDMVIVDDVTAQTKIGASSIVKSVVARGGPCGHLAALSARSGLPSGPEGGPSPFGCRREAGEVL